MSHDMTTTSRALCRPFVAAILGTALLPAWAADTQAPTLQLLQQTGGGAEQRLSLQGQAQDNVRVSRVNWRNERGGSGQAVLSGDRRAPQWRVDGLLLKKGDNRITLTARDAAGNVGTLSLVASYQPASRVTLSVVLNGQGSVSSTPAGIACGSQCQASFTQGSQVQLVASAAQGWRFDGWSAAAASCAASPSCTLTLSQAQQVQARFVQEGLSGAPMRLSVSGAGHVRSDEGSLACGSVPAALASGGSRCAARLPSRLVTLTAQAFNEQFRFAGWRGDCSGAASTCIVDGSRARQVGALFVPVSPSVDVCAAQGLKSDRQVYRLGSSFPALAPGQAFTDLQFGTTLRRVSQVASDGRGSHRVLKTLYSTVSAWNADESLMVLYRTDGGPAVHELWDGKRYQFIRKLDDIAPVDLEQLYWDTQDPDLLYYANRSENRLYRYRVSTRQAQLLHDFRAQCGSKELHGGSDPLFNSWNSQKFGFACTPDGALFSYDQSTDRVGTLLNGQNLDYGAPQAAPSGQLFFLNQNDGNRSDRSATVRDADMKLLRTLDMASANEHGALSLLSSGEDTWNTVAFDTGPGGSGIGTLVQHNLQTGQAKVLVGPSRGYPYPPSGTHVGATAFHRTGLVAVSVKDDRKGDSLLDTELLFVDTDPATNPAQAICRVGHHRSLSDSYWAEPHPVLSPSGTRILFSSSWGDKRDPGAVVDVYVLELPGYKP